jgi:hypothetical protein
VQKRLGKRIKTLGEDHSAQVSSAVRARGVDDRMDPTTARDEAMPMWPDIAFAFAWHDHACIYVHGWPTHASRAWIGGNVRASRGFNLEQCYAGIICVGIHCTSSNLEVCRADGVLIDEVEPFVAGRTRSIMWQGRLDRACWGRREPDGTKQMHKSVWRPRHRKVMQSQAQTKADDYTLGPGSMPQVGFYIGPPLIIWNWETDQSGFQGRPRDV